MQQQGQYGMHNMNFNMGYGFAGQQQQQPFNMQGNNMYNMMPFYSILPVLLVTHENHV